MRAFRMFDWGAAPSHEEVPVPEPGAGQVLVRVAGCGLCRSDLTMQQMPRPVGEKLGWQMPFTLGHETAGRLDDGSPVALVATASCGRCRLCVRGLESVCPHGLTGRGYGRDGGLAEYVLADRRSVLPLGDLDPRHAGPLTDAGATAYHAVRRALPRIVPGGTTVVIGAGGLGAFAVQFLRVLTATTVIAVDPAETRRAYAESVGAHQVLSGLELLPRRLGADAVLDFVGADQTIAAGIAAVRPGGAYGLIGSAGGRLDRPWFGTLPRDGEVFTFQGSTIADAQEVIALAAAGLVRNQVEEFPFEKVEEAYERLATGTLTGRAVIVL
ncbi:alcohol dehydrogenase catalytic domain-containing protein [Actinoplanes sp. KI2]|uniref:alcohol dehydrogenase catalytic domain-containing protein n=1 Tax=Actinoplanes sp. KI2 TaxID=2983315 RepID=UPI0021D5F5C8|nr:alcohol dehydrogenase catalytic domain-containing protein [Actinoplanes sp. KI2]MCU7728029.1 alcohol dehydrogenase catalytic domain-containing protein [Actinoplanes sp. KI2]